MFSIQPQDGDKIHVNCDIRINESVRFYAVNNKGENMQTNAANYSKRTNMLICTAYRLSDHLSVL